MTNEIKTQGTLEVGFELVQDAEGKFKRKAIYNLFSSIVPETREQKINFMNLIDGDIAQQMNDHIGKEIEVADVIFNPYDSVNEETGELINGVNTFLITEEGVAYVTSSKSVHNTMKNIMKAFGLPHWSGDDKVRVKMVKKQGQKYKYNDLELIV